jgi:hypothetical protein
MGLLLVSVIFTFTFPKTPPLHTITLGAGEDQRTHYGSHRHSVPDTPSSITELSIFPDLMGPSLFLCAQLSYSAPFLLPLPFLRDFPPLQAEAGTSCFSLSLS